MPDITLTTVFGGPSDMNVLTSMLAHYASLGIDNRIVHINARSEEERHSATELVRASGATVGSVFQGRWIPSMNTLLLASTRGSRPSDWHVIADQDELQVYPDELTSVISYCDRNGYDFIEGCFIDRLAEGGRLVSSSQGVPLFDQYPIGALVTGNVMRAAINKVVAVRGPVVLTHGQHHALSGIGCPPTEMYVPVHHFKWTGQLKERLDGLKTGYGVYSSECQRLLDHIAGTDRIDIDRPDLLAARCEPDYPHWSCVVEARMQATVFSPQLVIQEQRRPDPAHSQRPQS
jgi:hypothetical protein